MYALVLVTFIFTMKPGENDLKMDYVSLYKTKQECQEKLKQEMPSSVEEKGKAYIPSLICVPQEFLLVKKV